MAETVLIGHACGGSLDFSLVDSYVSFGVDIGVSPLQDLYYWRETACEDRADLFCILFAKYLIGGRISANKVMFLLYYYLLLFRL